MTNIIKPRYCLKSGIKVLSFFKDLNQNKINYVLLRYRPEMFFPDYTGDFDILVDDNNVDFIISNYLYKTTKYDNVLIDLYSLRGTYGSSYKKLPYYPYSISKNLVRKKIKSKEGIYILEKKENYLALIFHLVYHKFDYWKKIKNDYYLAHELYNSELRESINYLTKDNHIKIPISKCIDILKCFNLLPTLDWVRKVLSYKKANIFLPFNYKFSEKQVCLYFLRDLANDNKCISFFISRAKLLGLSILDFKYLSRREKITISEIVRNGKWDAPYGYINSGIPFAYIIMYDANPRKPNISTRELYPYLRDAKFLTLKLEFREFVKTYFGLIKEVNPLHSTDDNNEVENILFKINVTKYWKLVNLMNSDHINFSTSFTFNKILKQNIRSKTSVGKYYGISAIKKEYNKDYRSNLKREIKVYKALFNKSYIPTLLYSNENHFIAEKITKAKNQKKLLKQNIQGVIQIIRELALAGFCNLDLHPGNFIVDPNNKIYIIDFEFTYKPRCSDYKTIIEKLFSKTDDYKRLNIRYKEHHLYNLIQWEKILGYSIINLLNE